jgi:hypothetical protein
MNMNPAMPMAELAPQRPAVDDGFLQQAGAEADAFAHDHDVCKDIIAATGPHSHHVVVLDDKAIDNRLWHHDSASLFRLLREPGVEARAQHRE